MVPQSLSTATTVAEVPAIDICEIDIECNELQVCLVTGKKYFTKRTMNTTCPRCQGTGTINVLSYKDRYKDVWADEVCPVCVGKGHKELKPRTFPIWWPRAMGIDDYIDPRERRMRRYEYPDGDPLLH